MAGSLKAPESFDFTGDVASRWGTWKRQVEWYIKTTRNDEGNEEVIVGALLTLLGSEGLRIYDTFVFANRDDAKKIGPVLQKFSDHFEPRRSECFERFKFLKRAQKQGESCENWLVDLRNLVKNCAYGNQVDSVLRDQIVMGVADSTVQEKLLFEKDLTLQKAIDIVRACEATKSQLDLMKGAEVYVVHRLQNVTRRNSTSRSDCRSVVDTNSRPSGRSLNNSCKNCGSSHPKNRCRAYNKECNACGKLGHFARCCRKPKSKNLHSATNFSTQHNAHSVQHSGEEYSSEEDIPIVSSVSLKSSASDFLIHALSGESEENEWFEEMQIENFTTKVKLDTGAACNVMPKEKFQCIRRSRQRLTPGPKVRSYGSKNCFLKVLGVQTCKIKVKGKVSVESFVVVDEPGQPIILGLPSCKKLGLVKRMDAAETQQSTFHLPDIAQTFADVFQGLGKLEPEYSITLKPDAVPVISMARRIPFALRKPVEHKLADMEKAEIIQRVEGPSRWVSPMVVVSKPEGEVRICMDPTELNKAIQRHHFSIPSAEELFGRLSSAKFFATLDATSGFYQIPLSESSSQLYTMATPFGRFRFRRLGSARRQKSFRVPCCKCSEI